jgi:outer membrane receptor protein involved in Fe transport
MFTNDKLAKSIKLALIAGLSAGSLSAANVAIAQNADAETVEKIEVTGSRIRSATLSSPSPLQILEAGDIDAAGITNIQELLLENPTFGTPAISRTNSNFNTASAGIATIDLRNLDTARTLVLVNGRRYVAGQPGSTAVDLNTIPAQFIERVEILTGGASSVYGSDAVAGVVNLVLKDDFEGLEFETQYGQSAEGDNTQKQFSLTSGMSSANGKGSMMFHLSYSDQGGVFSRDRDRSDVDIISEALFSGDPADFFTPREPFFSSFPPQGRFDTGGERFTFNQNNQLQQGFSTNGDGTIGPDGFNRNGSRTIAIPTERYLFSAKGDYELSDDHSVFFEGTYASTQTTTELEPFPFSSDDIYADGLVPMQFDIDGTIYNNPFVPADILAAGGDGNGDGLNDYFFARRLSDIGNRGNTAERDTYRFSVGFEGVVFDDWYYDLFYVYGQTNESQVSNGLVNVQNFRYALEAITDTLDLDGDGITNEAICLDATARSFGCVPINIFGFDSISAEAANYVGAPSLLITSLQQEIIGGNITGDLFELPAGAVGIAAGFEYREEKSSDQFDPLQQAGLNAGNAIPATFGEFDVTEVYVEANVPIIDTLALRAAVRASDYSTVGSTTSWNVGFEWEPTDWLRLRAIEAQSTRAPNINELFSPPGQTFPSGLNDPCTRTPIPAACTADPGVAQNLADNGGTFTLTQSDLQGISGFNRGNPDLSEEVGRSTTLGMVITPESFGIPVLEDMNLTIDYFNIEIEDAIVSTPRQFILDQCYGGGDTQFCDFITRRSVAAGNNSAGSIEFIDSAVSNSGGLSTEGVDLTATYSSEVGDGNLRARLAYTYVMEGEVVPLPGSEPNPFVGELGAAEHRWNLNVGYELGDIGLNLGATYIGESALDDQFLAGFDLAPGSVTVDAEIYVDAQVNYYINDNLEVFGGIDNILDNDPPPIISGLPGSDTGTETDAGTYDPIGQRWYVGIRARF